LGDPILHNFLAASKAAFFFSSGAGSGLGGGGEADFEFLFAISWAQSGAETIEGIMNMVASNKIPNWDRESLTVSLSKSKCRAMIGFHRII